MISDKMNYLDMLQPQTAGGGGTPQLPLHGGWQHSQPAMGAPSGGLSGQMGWQVGPTGDPGRPPITPPKVEGNTGLGSEMGWGNTGLGSQMGWPASPPAMGAPSSAAMAGQTPNYLELLLGKGMRSPGLAQPGSMPHWSQAGQASQWGNAANAQANRGSASDFSKFFMR